MQAEHTRADPVVSTIFFAPVAHSAEHLSSKEAATGAKPVRRSTLTGSFSSTRQNTRLISARRGGGSRRDHQTYAADVPVDGLVSKSERQGAIPWRRANCGDLVNRVSRLFEAQQCPSQPRESPPLFINAGSQEAEEFHKLPFLGAVPSPASTGAQPGSQAPVLGTGPHECEFRRSDHFADEEQQHVRLSVQEEETEATPVGRAILG